MAEQFIVSLRLQRFAAELEIVGCAGENSLDRVVSAASWIILCSKIAKAAAKLVLLVPFLAALAVSPLLSPTFADDSANNALAQLRAGWQNPSRSCRPHTRWWWPGNAVTTEGIDWQLQQMRENGIGGVEVTTVWQMYEKGNISYLSDDWLAMVRHAVQAAKARDMEVAMHFGPGVVFGGDWVPPEDRSKVLSMTEIDVEGPRAFDDVLPAYKPVPSQHSTIAVGPPAAKDDGKLVAVVAARKAPNGLDGDSLTLLTDELVGDRLRWQVPPGAWKIMVFRVNYTNQRPFFMNEPRDHWVVDHLSKPAMQRYCEHLGGAIEAAVGDEFGKTIDSMFSDSFEIKPHANTVIWTSDIIEGFQAAKGYDFRRYLPVIWYDIGEKSPLVCYDLNEYLHQVGRSAFYETLIDWCESRGIAARIQPHDAFPVELIEGSGMTTRAETECSIPYFDVATFPHKSSAAGLRFYRGGILSAEAYTHLYLWQRYRTTLHMMKRVTDQMLRDGVTKIYNHGYFYSPEMRLSPLRDVPFGNLISHRECWWPYYGQLAAYVARSCQMLRQGDTVSNILVVSPQAQEWTKRANWGDGWRVIEYGMLGKTLVANGYEFDPVNDDLLQNHSKIDQGELSINGFAYRIVVLPDIESMPVVTLRVLRDFVHSGGVLIALGRVPANSVGLVEWDAATKEVREIVGDLFGPAGEGRQHPQGGRTYRLANYELGKMKTHPREEDHPYKPTPPLAGTSAELIRIVRSHLPPDFSLPDNRQSDGLTFLHRRTGPIDIYFVTNMQPERAKLPVTFAVAGKSPEQWNPMTGEIKPVLYYREMPTGTEIPLDFAPYESTFIVFAPGDGRDHVVQTNLDEVREVKADRVTGVVHANGTVRVAVDANGKEVAGSAEVNDLPEAVEVTGTWSLELTDDDSILSRRVDNLRSWTDDPETQHFSGTGRYRLAFDMPANHLRPELEWVLDLGRVGSVAEVIVNGQNVGVRFQAPYVFDVGKHLRAGANELEVLVTNTAINRVAGMSEPPPVPVELQAHYGPTPPIDRVKPNEKIADFANERGFEPLPESGLIGPVRLLPSAVVEIPLE